MTVRLRARMVFEWEYDADPENYDTDDPATMAGIDQENFEAEPQVFMPDEQEAATWEITVVPA